MSLVSGSAFITCIAQGDQISAVLIPSKPLSQYLKKGTDGITPDWTISANQPVIYVRAKSQLQGTRKEIISGTEEWVYNGTMIAFNSSGVSTTPANLFQKETYDDGGVKVPALRIIGNLVSVTNTDSDRIEFIGAVEVGGIKTSVSPGIDIRLEETVGDPYDGYIDATEGGVIDDDTSAIVCTAVLLKGGAEVLSGVTYKWFQDSVGGWTAISSDTNKPAQKTFREEDINSELLIKCEFYIDNILVTTASRQLADETDPLIISPNPSGTTNLSVGGSVTFNPQVIRRGTGAVQSGYSFSYSLYSNNDAQIGTSSGTSISITYNQVIDNNGGIKLYITASK